MKASHYDVEYVLQQLLETTGGPSLADTEAIGLNERQSHSGWFQQECTRRNEWSIWTLTKFTSMGFKVKL